MSESAGQKLTQARLQRGLTLDEAARATRMRPEKILALENDDYACFPSNAYAKGFLKNYARYLAVDINDFLGHLDSSLAISIADYQYLNNAPERPVDTAPERRERRERRPMSFVPIAVGLLLAASILFGYWVRDSSRRIFAVSANRPGTSAPIVPSTAPLLPTVPPEGVKPAALSADATTAPPLASDPLPRLPNQNNDQDLLRGAVRGDPGDHDVVSPMPVSVPIPAAAGTFRSTLNEIQIASVKKTRVIVRQDDAKASPIFDDFIYPGIQPLKLHGLRFFIESADPASVQITKNGLPIAYQAPGVPIQ